MKLSRYVLPWLLAAGGSAAAQSWLPAQTSVTIYGIVDQAMGKQIGFEGVQVSDHGGTLGSRLGVLAAEDLGGGWRAFATFEQRFAANLGTWTTQLAWQGHSFVGLAGPYGTVYLGRHYTPAFELVQHLVDPFDGDGQGQLRHTAMLLTKTPIGLGPNVTNVAIGRAANALRYDYASGGFTMGVLVAETPAANPLLPEPSSRPFSVAANYTDGGFFIGAAWDDASDADQQLWNLGLRYQVGMAQLMGGYSRGTTDTGLPIYGWLVGAKVLALGGEIRLGVARADLADRDLNKAAVGFHYALSKRSKLYTDVARIGGSRTDPIAQKNGWDFGLHHVF